MGPTYLEWREIEALQARRRAGSRPRSLAAVHQCDGLAQHVIGMSRRLRVARAARAPAACRDEARRQPAEDRGQLSFPPRRRGEERGQSGPRRDHVRAAEVTRDERGEEAPAARRSRSRRPRRQRHTSETQYRSRRAFWTSRSDENRYPPCPSTTAAPALSVWPKAKHLLMPQVSSGREGARQPGVDRRATTRHVKHGRTRSRTALSLPERLRTTEQIDDSLRQGPGVAAAVTNPVSPSAMISGHGALCRSRCTGACAPWPRGRPARRARRARA